MVMQQSQQIQTHQFPSVTSILSLIDKPALAYWRSNSIADWLAETPLPKLGAVMRAMQRDEWRKYVHGIPFRAAAKGGTRSAAALGTVIHDACEAIALDLRPAIAGDDEAFPFLQQFAWWLEREQPTFEASEMTVVGRGRDTRGYDSPHDLNPDLPYAGTLDGIWTWRGQRIIVDYKTNRDAYDKDGKPTGPYPEAAFQLAAYRFADLALATRKSAASQFRKRWYEVDDLDLAAAEPMPKTDGAYVCHLTPSSCRMYPVNASEETFGAFMSLRAFHEVWTNGPTLIGHYE